MSRQETAGPRNDQPSSAIKRALQDRTVDGRLPCAAAHAAAIVTGSPPLSIGQAAEALALRISRCQLGFFGYPGKQGFHEIGVAELEVPDGLAGAIREAAGETGTASCAALWQIAAQFGIPRMLAGYVADQGGIRVAPCQLGVL